MDLLYIGIGIVFFAVTYGLLRACEMLMTKEK
jgi:hypothetical protein